MLIYLTSEEIMEELLKDVINARDYVDRAGGDDSYLAGRLVQATDTYTRLLNLNESKRREAMEDFEAKQKAADAGTSTTDK